MNKLGPPPVGGLTDGEHALLMRWAETFATAKLLAERERCIAWLDAEHQRRQHLDNFAGVFALRMREDLERIPESQSRGQLMRAAGYMRLPSAKSLPSDD